jgi:hypothetical protein
VRLPGLFKLWGGLALAFTLLAGGPRQELPLQLRQVQVHQFPDSLRLTGVAAGPEGELVTWSRLTGSVLWLRNGTWQSVGSGQLRRPIVAALPEHTGRMEVLDVGLGEILAYSPAGEIVQRTSFDTVPSVAAAARGVDDWYIVRDSIGRKRIDRISDSGRVETIATLPRPVAGPPDSTGVTLSYAPAGLLVSHRSAPYRAYLVRNTGETIPFAVPSGIMESRDDGHSPAATWAAFPVVPIPNGYLQTYADLTSDRRLVATYASDLRLLRSTPLDLPLTFHASSIDASTLIGFTRLSEVEIHVFELAREPISPQRR